MCSYQRLWCSVLSFETHTIVHNFVLCISLDNMRRIIFAIACITLMVRPPLDHLPNPSLCWPKIDNLLKCSANHVQHEDTEPHEHCDIYHWCGKKLRMLGWRLLCSLTLCWLLTGLHVFSNHHTINILQFRTWLSTPLTPIAYCMITDLSYQYKHEYYSIRCITNMGTIIMNIPVSCIARGLMFSQLYMNRSCICVDNRSLNSLQLPQTGPVVQIPNSSIVISPT